MAFRSLSEDVVIDSGVEANLRSYNAAESISAGQVVKLDTGTDNSVEPSDTDAEEIIGVAVEDASSGDQVTVARDGVKVRATSGTGSITTGDWVSSYGATGEEGEVQTATQHDASGGTDGDYVLGKAVGDDAGTNDDVLVEIQTGRI